MKTNKKNTKKRNKRTVIICEGRICRSPDIYNDIMNHYGDISKYIIKFVDND